MKGAFAGVQTQVAALNAQLESMIALQNGVDASGYERMAQAAATNSRNFRNAAASTGMFEVQQLKLNRATDDYVKRLNKQQMSFRELAKQRKVAAAAYKEQLAMENMVVRRNASGVTHGKDLLDVTYPKQISAELSTANKELAWWNAQLKSGAHQMVNWGKNVQWAGRQLMVGFTMPVAAFGAAAGVMAYQVDKELTRIAKVYDTTADATTGNLEDIQAAEKELMAVREQATQTAIQAARDYGSAGTDTLNVQAELAATGLKGAQLQEYTNEVMRISTLGELEYADSIQATISLQSVFQMSTQELTEAFNYMNAVENATSLQTKDFAAAIPIAAAPVKAFGGDIKELGVLLTAMKERGIEATQGANAIKAAMQRLGRPSAQVQEEWKALTNTDITKIFNDSESLTDLFKQIGAATENLTDKEKIKAFAGLFGTYQVTRMTALVEGMANLEAGTGQVSAAAQLATADVNTLADTAARELAQQAESVSGKWDRAFQEMKLQMSTLGEPFLEVATYVVRGISWIIDKFNELPGIMKTVIASGIGLAAIAGPLVMLTGLFGNLFGSTLKGISILIGLGTSMNIVDKESRAAALATELAEQGFLTEAKAVQQLTVELKALTLAQMEANRATSLASSSSASRANAAATAALAAAGGTALPLAAQQPVISRGANGALDINTALLSANAAQSGLTDKTNDTAAAQGKLNKLIAGGALGTAAMASGMLLTMTNSNEVANAFGNMLIIGTMVVPAVATLVPLLIRAAKSAWSFAAGMRAAGTAAGAGGKTGILATLGPMMKNPLGLAAAAVTAVGVGIYAWKKHTEAAREEQIRLNKSINSAADTWAKGAGKARKEWEGLTLAQKENIKLTRQQEKFDAYRSGDLEQVSTDFKELEPGTEQNMFLDEHFMELQVEYGLSAKEAAENIKALLSASGYGIEAQDAAVSRLMANIGEIKQSNIGKYLKNQLDILSEFDYGTEEWSTAAKDAGTAFTTAFNDAASPEQAERLLSDFTTAATAEWGHMFEQLKDDPTVSQIFETMGIDSAEALRKGVRDAGGIDEFMVELESLPGMGDLNPETWLHIRDTITEADAAEREFFGNVASGSSVLGQSLDDNIDTLSEFVNAWQVNTKTLNYDEAVKSALALKAALKQTAGAPAQDDPLTPIKEQRSAYDEAMAASYRLARADKKREINQMNINLGYKQGKTFAEAIYNLTHKIAAGTNSAASAARNLASAYAFAKSELASMQQAGYEGVKNQIADMYREDMDASHEQAMENRQDYWESESDALSNAHEAAGRAMDARWERRNNAADAYWDKRIENVDKAIEAEEKAEEKRQKMFDAEIARINKLNDMANANIDFNVALNSGDLDEAARIRNNVTAGDAQTVLEREAGRGSEASERRVEDLNDYKENLEKRREAHKKALERQEARERRHMEKVQQMEVDRLEDRKEANLEALEAEQEMQKEALERELELFLAQNTMTEKQLIKHLNKMGLSYDAFGDILKRKGTNWGEWFGSELHHHMRVSALQMASDKMWQRLGEGSRNGILKGMGFGNMSDFRHFLETGQIRNTGGKNRGGSGTGTHNKTENDGWGEDRAVPHHAGGMIGRDKPSRRGVARTQKGLHPSEQMVLAQKGEYVVNRDAAAKYGNVLDKINSGEAIGDTGQRHGSKRYGTGGPGPLSGIAAFAGGIMGSMFSMGVGRAMQSAVDKKKMQMATQPSAGGSYAAGKAGMYSDRNFNMEQLKNAAIIASVGSRMGMSQRDLMIGIMTAITESGLINVNYGDRDSLGLFQQRPSMGWGTAEQVTNPEYAAKKFFEGLKGVENRAMMDPWLAAQAVQRSFDPTGSNYRQYWDNAKAIFRTGIKVDKQGNYAAAQYAAGSGGWARPVPGGYNFSNTHDIGVPVGTPVYAVGDGTIVSSRYITSGGSPGNGGIAPNGMPYRSYGETIALQTKDGLVNYAHLQAGSRVAAGKRVKGGEQIARSGNTGNSSGPHLHLDIGGAQIAQSWLRARGISLSKGAARVNFDNTVANLHKGEAVLTEDLNKKFHQGVENFANGGNNEYNVKVNLYGSDLDANQVADIVVAKLKKAEKRKPQSRRA